MNFTKPPLTLEEQANLLLVRGMAGDRNLMIERLAVVNYYRLSGYWYPLRNPDDTFQVGTSFEMVWRRYTFDRQLRLQVMDAIERNEVAVRTLLAYQHTHLYGPFAYTERQDSLPGKSQKEWEGCLGPARRSVKSMLLGQWPKRRSSALPSLPK